MMAYRKYVVAEDGLWYLCPEPEFINKMKRQLERYLFGKSTFQMGFLNTCRKDIFSPLVKRRSHAQ